jgi:hypothetical protein
MADKSDLKRGLPTVALLSLAVAHGELRRVKVGRRGWTRTTDLLRVREAL